MFNFNKGFLLIVFILALLGLGAEIYSIILNGIQDSEEFIFQILVIAFWLLLTKYVINSFNSKMEEKNKNTIDFE